MIFHSKIFIGRESFNGSYESHIHQSQIISDKVGHNAYFLLLVPLGDSCDVVET